MGAKKDKRKALAVEKVAHDKGVTPRYVYQVINSDRDDEEIHEYYQGVRESIDNALLSAVNQLVPFN